MCSSENGARSVRRSGKYCSIRHMKISESQTGIFGQMERAQHLFCQSTCDILLICVRSLQNCSGNCSLITQYYYTTQAVRGPITKINQSKCSIAGPIFSKYWTRHCPEWSRTCVFAVFAFFSRVINLLLTKLALDRTGRISALGLFCTYCQDLGRYSPCMALALV